MAPLTVFVHIPKTAGTTVAAVFRDNFPGGVGTVGNAFKATGGYEHAAISRLREAPVHATRHMHVLSGHLPFAVREALPEDTRFVTFLRDPVERTLSQYYGLQKLSRRKELPGDGSLGAVLAEGDIIYDNLQTRMLADDDEPVGDVDEETVEQAKDNLRSRFLAFGLVERFDESLVLIKRALELRSIAYVQRRASARPRGSEVSAEELRLAEEANQYDNELYAFARELFDERVAEHGLDFAADVAGLDMARTGAARPAPAAADASALWDLLVRTRAELFVERRDRVDAEAAARGETRDLLVALRQDVNELSRRMTGRAVRRGAERNAGRDDRADAGRVLAPEHANEAAEGPRPTKERPERRQRGDRDAAAPDRAQKRERLDARAAELDGLRADLVTQFERIDERLRAMEGAGDGEGSIELERLRRGREQLEERLAGLTTRTSRFQKRSRHLSAGAKKGHMLASPGEDEREADE